MAAQSTAFAKYVIYDSGLEALPIGGLDGTNPVPTLAQLQAGIQHGRFHLVWVYSDIDPRLRWVIAHCTQTSDLLLYDYVPADAG
jgi:hypothetical protein